MPRALWWSYGGGAVSYERGTPVGLPRTQWLQFPCGSTQSTDPTFSSSSLLSSLELSDANVYEPYIRALLMDSTPPEQIDDLELNIKASEPRVEVLLLLLYSHYLDGP